jgi:hypothetical protein
VLKGHVRKIKSVKRELENVLRKELSDANIAREKELTAEIEKLLE